MMLTQYCMEHDFDIFDIYVDDGYSGLNFNRPDFHRLIEDIEKGKIDIVITKDLSRLGRDYIQTGYYTDVYFVTKRVRYIAVNDGIDTQRENNDIVPFKNILNDMYAKDISRKTKTAKLQRAQNGFYVSSQPPYGYKVNPFNRNQLIIDDEAAKVVRMIFDLAEEGYNSSQICRILEQRQIMSPSAYKAMNGDTRFLRHVEDQNQIYKWKYQTVRAILLNPVYVGDMVNHKVEVINYKTKKRVYVPIEQQIVVRDTHEAIIDRERFEWVRKNGLRRRKPNHKLENIFKGIICCSECGRALQLISQTVQGETKGMFRCLQHVQDKTVCTHNHFIYYDELYAEVQKQWNLHMTEMLESEDYDKLCEKIGALLQEEILKLEKNNAQKELMFLNRKIKEYYKSLPNGSKEITSQLALLLSRQKELIQTTTSLNFCKAPQSTTQDWQEVIKRQVKEYLQILPLTEETLKLLVKRIEIGHLERSPCGVSRKIKIYYYF